MHAPHYACDWCKECFGTAKALYAHRKADNPCAIDYARALDEWTLVCLDVAHAQQVQDTGWWKRWKRWKRTNVQAVVMDASERLEWWQHKLSTFRVEAPETLEWCSHAPSFTVAAIIDVVACRTRECT